MFYSSILILPYYIRYLQSLEQPPKKFHGVTLEDIPDLKKLFEANVFVYNLEPTGDDGEEGDENNEEEKEKPEIAAHLVYRSHRHYTSTLYLNLHKKHFSYIKDMKHYSHSFCCSRCGKYWKHDGMLHRRERTCDAKVQYKFSGGAYTIHKTVFDLLEDEGFTDPSELRYFPYRATFDFECMFDRNNCPNDSAKLHWEAKHVLLSVSVYSNVSGYDQPKCFISNGDSRKFVQDMVKYLVDISQESYRLLKQEFATLFEEIDEKLGPDDQNEQHNSEEEDSNNEGEDLMNTDDEEEEEIDSETEEDLAFLNDEELEEEGPSFYQAFNMERPDQELIQHERASVNAKEKKKKESPLKKLKDRLEGYLKELPVIGFNSGKYDLNVVKEVLFPVLVKEEVKFTIKRNNNLMCLKTEHLRFLDIINFLATGFTYDKFLKAYECPQTKGFFPYEWMDSLDKLDSSSIPPHEAFYSSLKGCNISLEEYQYC